MGIQKNIHCALTVASHQNKSERTFIYTVPENNHHHVFQQFNRTISETLDESCKKHVTSADDYIYKKSSIQKASMEMKREDELANS